MPFPFEMKFEEIETALDAYVNTVFASLTSDFLVLPKGNGFVEYPIFEQGYEALKRVTQGFTEMEPEAVFGLALDMPISVIVLRSILGLTAPEWAYLATQATGVNVPQGAARQIDKKLRTRPLEPIRARDITTARIEALITIACKLIKEGAPVREPEMLHRLDKVDTFEGLPGIQALAGLGVPYSMLLYERFLGRPFAGHRDAVSDLVGDLLETAIETALSDHGISYRKTKRAERVSGFAQAPDFIIPNEFNPAVIIEAKQAEDDGTARDKVARVQQLRTLSLEGQPHQQPKYEVVACIAGRGFGVRKEDMKKLLVATQGKVFTLQNLPSLIEHTRLKHFVTKTPVSSATNEPTEN